MERDSWIISGTALWAWDDGVRYAALLLVATAWEEAEMPFVLHPQLNTRQKDGIFNFVWTAALGLILQMILLELAVV